MFGFIKKRIVEGTVERLRIEKEFKAEYDREMEEAELELYDAQVAMTHKPCPINNNLECFVDCVHFQKGNYYYFSFEDCYGRWQINYPKCKLWSKGL